MSTRTRVRAAFRALRRRGWFARADWQCCQSCGFAAVPPDRAERVVFFHRQDAEDLRDRGEVYLAWSGPADELVAALRAAGLTVSWSGSADRRILVWESSSAAADSGPTVAPAEAPGYH